MNYEELIQHCIGLRRALERDEARFFLGLVAVEEHHMQLLRDNGCDTFDMFIRSHELCRVERYRAFSSGLRALGDRERAQALGAPAVIAAAKLRDASRAESFVAAIEAWTGAHNGLTPRTETAERLLRQVDPRPEVPQVVRRESELDQMRVANQELTRKCASLERTIAKLKKRIAELEGKSAAA